MFQMDRKYPIITDFLHKSFHTSSSFYASVAWTSLGLSSSSIYNYIRANRWINKPVNCFEMEIIRWQDFTFTPLRWCTWRLPVTRLLLRWLQKKDKIFKLETNSRKKNSWNRVQALLPVTWDEELRGVPLALQHLAVGDINNNTIRVGTLDRAYIW